MVARIAGGHGGWGAHQLRRPRSACSVGVLEENDATLLVMLAQLSGDSAIASSLEASSGVVGDPRVRIDMGFADSTGAADATQGCANTSAALARCAGSAFRSLRNKSTAPKYCSGKCCVCRWWEWRWGLTINVQ